MILSLFYPFFYIKDIAIGVFGLSCEDALTHLLNHVWPNIFETSPHVINAVMEAVEGMRVGLGPCRILQYTLQGIFHPARRGLFYISSVTILFLCIQFFFFFF